MSTQSSSVDFISTPNRIERGKFRADCFEMMPHTPDELCVKASYQQFIWETKCQFEAVINNGLVIEPWFHTAGEPYRNSRAMIADVRKNHHLYFLPTVSSFGDDAPPEDNPLLELMGVVINGYHLCANDLFRVTHDAIGHAQNGNQFGPNGEERAWADHLPIFSPLARPAFTTESRGQSSWFYFGPHLRDKYGRIPQSGELGFIPYRDRPFAEQKVGLLPPQISGVALTYDSFHKVIHIKEVAFM